MDEVRQRIARQQGHSPVQWLENPFGDAVPIRLAVKRDDLLHTTVSGNKWRKLYYNLLEAHRQGCPTLLTFGGAYSNHLYATAAAGEAFGFQTIGVVRGEELAHQTRNETLAFCEAHGMQLRFVSRDAYRHKHEPDFLSRVGVLPDGVYVLPEGGTNALAIRGTAEIMPELTGQLGFAPDYVACAVGTGGTLAGLAQAAPAATTVLGVPVLKGVAYTYPNPNRVRLLTDYHFGGYARTTPALLGFIENFTQRTGIPLEPIYTGKMMFALYDLARQGFFAPDTTVVALHTGGLRSGGLRVV